MADNLVPITIDGQPLEVPRGTLVVEAARQIGVEIPVYCYHPKMRQKIKEVMRFAGPRMIWYHPIWTLKHLWRER